MLFVFQSLIWYNKLPLYCLITVSFLNDISTLAIITQKQNKKMGKVYILNVTSKQL